MISPESTLAPQPAQRDPMLDAQTSVFFKDIKEGAAALGMSESNPTKVLRALVSFAKNFAPTAVPSSEEFIGFAKWCHENLDTALKQFLDKRRWVEVK